MAAKMILIYSRNSWALTQLPCRPCHKPTCRLEHHRCMRDIPAEQVLQAAQRALKEISPSAGA